MAASGTTGTAPGISQARQLSNLIMGEHVVRIYVGTSPGQKTFVVHKKLLTSKIAYFADMFKDPERKLSDEVAVFLGDSVEVFELLQRWLYYGGVGVYEGHVEVEHDDTLAIGLYALAEKLSLHEVQDLIIDAVATDLIRSAKVLRLRTIELIYEKTSPRSGLRRFAAQFVAYVVLEGKENLCWNMVELVRILRRLADLDMDVLSSMRKRADRNDNSIDLHARMDAFSQNFEPHSGYLLFLTGALAADSNFTMDPRTTPISEFYCTRGE